MQQEIEKLIDAYGGACRSSMGIVSDTAIAQARSALLDAVREAVKDSERLEWLVAKGFVPCLRRHSDDVWVLEDYEPSEGATYRDAMDVARTSDA